MGYSILRDTVDDTPIKITIDRSSTGIDMIRYSKRDKKGTVEERQNMIWGAGKVVWISLQRLYGLLLNKKRKSLLREEGDIYGSISLAFFPVNQFLRGSSL